MNITEIEELVTPVLEQESVELVDVESAPEGAKQILRFFVDKPAGITLDDCAYLSDRIGAILEESGKFPENYILEISSPGIDRIVKKEKDFKRFSGKRIKIRLKTPQDGRRNFSGLLVGYEDKKVLLDDQGKIFKLDHESIDEARLDMARDV